MMRQAAEPPSGATRPFYEVSQTPTPPDLEGGWDGCGWLRASTLDVACFRPEGSDHRPRTQVRLLYDACHLYGVFRVADRYVRVLHTGYGTPVYRDSCVEIFLQPRPDRGYLNFEFNAGGALLASHVRDPERTPQGFRDFTPLTEAEARAIGVRASLPTVVKPERTEPVTWTVAFALPFALLEKHLGPVGTIPGQRWRANFYKCADDTSHPHWASWSPLTERNFHLPACFGELRFLA